MNYKLWFWIINVATALLRLFFIGKVGLTVDEAHYWVYTKFLSLSYYDHPPLIAYIIKISTLLFGNNPFAVRLPAVVIFFTTSWIFFICAKKLYNERTAFAGIVLLNLLPVFSFLGALVSIPDSPLAFFWILSLLLFILIIETNKKKYWYLLGIAVGFALLSKYNAVMIPAGIFLFLILSPKHGFWLKQKEPYLAFLITLTVFMPVIIWNIQNGWISFGFQLGHGFGTSVPKISPTLFFRSLGAQAAYVSPFIFPVFCAAVWLCLKEAFIKKDRSALIIACFAFPTIIFFNIVAAFNEILPHWPTMGYLILTIYAAYIVLKYCDSVKSFTVYIKISYILTFALLIIAPLHLIYKVVPVEKFLPAEQKEKIRHGIAEAERTDISNDLFGWDELGDKIRKIIASYPAKNKPFIFTHKSYLASQIAFAVPEIRVYCLSDKTDAYDLWQKSLREIRNKNALFICNDFYYRDPREYAQAFASYSQEEEFPIYRNGKKVKNFFFTHCKRFSPSKLDEKYTAKHLGEKRRLATELRKADYAIFKFINSGLHNTFTDFYASVFSYCDSLNFNLGLVTALIFSLIILFNNGRQTFWTNIALMTSILIASSLIVYFMKSYFARPRPLKVFGEENVNFFYEKMYTASFPSGHTNAAWALAVFMFMFVRKYWYWYFLFAFATAFERIYVGSHFPSDVIAGGLLGAFTAYIMVTVFKKLIS